MSRDAHPVSFRVTDDEVNVCWLWGLLLDLIQERIHALEDVELKRSADPIVVRHGSALSFQPAT